MDAAFWWILGSGVGMAAVALAGGLVLLGGGRRFQQAVLPLVALAAGALVGGALFHLLPEAIAAHGAGLGVWVGVAAGLVAFFCLEQFLQWHHCHRPASQHARPLGYLTLFADTLHNLLDGLAVGSAFVVDPRLGLTTWLVAAAHEVPQELGDFGVLVRAGWRPRRALALNVASGLAFLTGGLLTWALSRTVEVSWLLPFAAGSFLYTAVADLVPEVNRHPDLRVNLLHLGAFVSGIGLLLGIAVWGG